MAYRWYQVGYWNDLMRQVSNSTNAAAAAKQTLERTTEELEKAKRELEKAKKTAGNAGKKELDAATKKLEAQLQELESELRIELGRMQTWLREELEAMGKDIADLERRTAAVERNVAELKRQMDDLLRRMANEKEGKRQRALLYSGQLSGLISDVFTLHGDKLTPLEAEELRQTAELIAADLEAEDYEAAIGVAQTKIPVAAALYVRLQELNEEYNRLLEATCYGETLIHDFRDRLADAEQNRTVLPETQMEYDGEIDYWSEGGFTEITDHIARAEVTARDAEERMDLEAMTAYVETLPETLRSLGACHNRAVGECTLSHQCELQSYDIHEQLTSDSSWECEDYGFEEDDQRRCFRAVYHNGGGMTATVVVLPQREIPDPELPEQSVYLVHLCDGETVENTVLCGIARDAIYARLRKVPLHPGSGLGQRAATASPSVRMFRQHMQQQTADMKRERLTPLVQTAKQG